MRGIALMTLLLFSFFSSLFFLPSVDAGVGNGSGTGDLYSFDGTFPWNPSGLDTKTDSTSYITYTQYRTSYCTFASTPTQCDVTDDEKIIRIDTAEELYRWSTDVSFLKKYANETQKFTEAQVAVILDQNYALGNNIDYSTMASKKFSPIGYSFSETNNTPHENFFTGTFDGQGFVISNLYVGGYDFMVFVDTADIAIFSFYSMFLANRGHILNLGLINPTLELLNYHPTITKVSNLVGLNQGVVDHVFVVDTRTSVTDAGIRYKVGNNTGNFQAAGVVHTNEGQFTNAYYSSPVVVNGSYINKFAAQPVLYLNQGSNYVYGQLAFDLNPTNYAAGIYKYPTVTVGSSTFNVTPLNGLATAESTVTLKSGVGSVLDDIDDRWHFYANDCYPLTQGFDFVDGNYLITSAVDLAFFSRVLSFNTQNNAVRYDSAHYLLTADIDMSILAPGAYVTPAVDFLGELSGDNPAYEDVDGLQHNFYIDNLNFTTGTVRSTGYYTGLFSIVRGSGNIHHLNITDMTVFPNNTESYYSYQFYVGTIAGRMIGAKIENVMVDADIHLGTTSIGATFAGGIVGQASGIVNQVAFYGTINGGAHVFNSAYSITPNYYIGGIVGGTGTTTQLTLSSVVNNAPITGFSTASTFTLASGSTAIAVKTGGVIGYIVNSSTVRHRMIEAANTGGITIGNVINTVSLPSTQRVGGVFGELVGNAPVLQSGENMLFGNLFNSGNITATYATQTSPIKAAGIGVNNASEAVEYALMFNEGTFVYYNAPASSTNPYPFRYTGTIYDIGSSPVTISRAYNYGNRTFTTNYYKDISPLYYSDSNNATLIRYSANYGNILYYLSSGITLSAELRISGITSNTNVNYLNVTNKGNITVAKVNVGSAYSIFVAGITPVLSADKWMKNCLNEGNLTMTEITGTANIYAGGLVTMNYAGDLHEAGQPAGSPRATEGIINSINKGNITSYYLDTVADPDIEYNGINAALRSFVAGVATLNSGSIQDTANLGNIYFYNRYTSGSTTFESSNQYGGRVLTYNSSVTAGGIVAIVLSGTSRIYDSANNGDITILSGYYVRAGGILGVSFAREAELGSITSALGYENTTNPIATSKVANGLNFGNITALCNQVGAYTATASNHDTTISVAGGTNNGASLYFIGPSGSSSRPGVYACAGGVIGYGLCVMSRMLNHGTIASTDVAGGVVGATYVLGGTSADAPGITVVNIDTAINYGDIKAFPAASYSGMGKVDLTFNTIKTLFLADGNTTIFPTNLTREEPAAKRGFGGVFGRIQRGQFGIMTTKHPTTGELGKFNFIVNANPNIDLIGRLDQDTTFTGSSKYFRFNDAVYYSARVDDTTQVVFTGFYYAIGPILVRTGSSSPYTYTIRATTLYKNVGIISTQYSTPGTSFTMRSSSSLTLYALDEYYYGPVKVPYISESELWESDFTSYVYDENFSMRKTADSYTANVERDYTIDAVTGDLENPSGSVVIDNDLLFDTLGDAQTYKASHPSDTVYYTDANGDIRTLSGTRVYAKGLPYSSTLAYTYTAYLSAFTCIKDDYYLTYNIDGSNNLVSSTAAIASTYLKADLAAATLYDQQYNTAYYRAVSRDANVRGLYNAAGVRTHTTTTAYSTYTYISGTLPSGNIAAATLYRNTSTNVFYTNSGLTNLALDSSIIFTTQAAATAYVKRIIYYFSGSDIYSFNNGTTALYATYVSTNLYRSVDGYYMVLSGGSLYRTVYSTQLFTSVQAAYNYKVANPNVPVYYYSQYSPVWGKYSNIYLLTLKDTYYVSTNYTLTESNVLVDSTGSTVLSAGDLDGTPNTISADNGNIYVTTTGTVLYTYTPSLTEYVYFMEYHLLAPRFRNVVDGGTGLNPRPNGMYVLSTTAGSTYGSVLPSNLNLDLLRPIDEDSEPVLPLSSGYPVMDSTYLLPWSQGEGTTYTGYMNLRQTIFNDKSNLFEFPIVPVTLTETGAGSSGTVLSNGTVDYAEKKITYQISMEAFSTGGVAVSYQVTHAETSANALVACRASDYDGFTTLAAFSYLLRQEGAQDISLDYPPELTLTLPSKTITTNQTVTLGYFTVYSEAFVGDNLFASSAYYTDYLVEVVFTPGADYISTGSLAITNVAFNGGGAVDITDIPGNGSVVADGDVNYNGSITFHFTDTKGVLTSGQDLKTYVRILMDDGITEVSPAYYSLSSTLVSITNVGGTLTGTGSVTVSFTNRTKKGNYRFCYRYFSSSTEYYVTFDKAASNVAAVLGLDYYSAYDSVLINGTAITSGINLGYGLTLGPSQTQGNINISNATVPAYLDGTTYTVVYRSGYPNSFTISPFATLTDAYVQSVTYNNGYITYDIRYVVLAEDGVTQVTYTHTIVERSVALTSVLKNGNEVSFSSGVDAAREDEHTFFTIDLGLDQALTLYRLQASTTLPYIVVTATYNNGSGAVDISSQFTAYDLSFTVPEEGNEGYLVLDMGYGADPGTYVFTFDLYRGNTGYHVTVSLTLTVVKNAGTNSHLNDIRFSELATETQYPSIRIVDAAGNEITVPAVPTEAPAVYFAGIDYDGADANPNYHYWVNGYVSNTPLFAFLPLMTDYLPYGASIQRRYYTEYNNPASETWTDPVYADSTQAEKATLAADFTRDPYTGIEGENVAVLYRVISEDLQHTTYYYVTVTDVSYNVTVLFNIYYCSDPADDETCKLASTPSSGFQNQLIMITILNLLTDNPDNPVTPIENPANFPKTFYEVEVQTQVTQFYLTYGGAYKFSFGRNLSGYFSFSLFLPEDQYLNDRYTYEIKYGGVPLEDFPANSEGIGGKYFWIVGANFNRTRSFDVYIRPIQTPETDSPWGLYDFFVSWWD
jgi:hypothetical protein